MAVYVADACKQLSDLYGLRWTTEVSVKILVYADNLGRTGFERDASAAAVADALIEEPAWLVDDEGRPHKLENGQASVKKLSQYKLNPTIVVSHATTAFQEHIEKLVISSNAKKVNSLRERYGKAMIPEPSPSPAIGMSPSHWCREDAAFFIQNSRCLLFWIFDLSGYDLYVALIARDEQSVLKILNRASQHSGQHFHFVDFAALPTW